MEVFGARPGPTGEGAGSPGWVVPRRQTPGREDPKHSSFRYPSPRLYLDKAMAAVRDDKPEQRVLTERAMWRVLKKAGREHLLKGGVTEAELGSDKPPKRRSGWSWASTVSLVLLMFGAVWSLWYGVVSRLHTIRPIANRKSLRFTAKNRSDAANPARTADRGGHLGDTKNVPDKDVLAPLHHLLTAVLCVRQRPPQRQAGGRLERGHTRGAGARKLPCPVIHGHKRPGCFLAPTPLII